MFSMVYNNDFPKEQDTMYVCDCHVSNVSSYIAVNIRQYVFMTAISYLSNPKVLQT